MAPKQNERRRVDGVNGGLQASQLGVGHPLARADGRCFDTLLFDTLGTVVVEAPKAKDALYNTPDVVNTSGCASTRRINKGQHPCRARRPSPPDRPPADTETPTVFAGRPACTDTLVPLRHGARRRRGLHGVGTEGTARTCGVECAGPHVRPQHPPRKGSSEWLQTYIKIPEDADVRDVVAPADGVAACQKRARTRETRR